MDDTCTGSEGEECLVGSPPEWWVARPTLPGMCSNQTPWIEEILFRMITRFHKNNTF